MVGLSEKVRGVVSRRPRRLRVTGKKRKGEDKR